MAPLRWSANLSMLWRDRPFLERFGAARDAGFDTVEFWWPRGSALEDVERAVSAHDLRISAINMDAGDLDAGDRGFLNLPERRAEVLRAAAEGLDLARAVGSPLMNCPVGKDSGRQRDEQADVIVATVRAIADLARPAGVLVTLEPLNALDHPSYLLCSSTLAVEWIERAGPGVALLYDAYHLGAMGEDIVAGPALLPVAHIQIADWPGRHEPGTGHLPLEAFFEAIEAMSYDGHIGLEYAPTTTTEESLAWLRRRDAAAVSAI